MAGLGVETGVAQDHTNSLCITKATALAWSQLCCCAEKHAGPVAAIFSSLSKKQWETTTPSAENVKLWLTKLILVFEEGLGIFYITVFSSDVTTRYDTLKWCDITEYSMLFPKCQIIQCNLEEVDENRK